MMKRFNIILLFICLFFSFNTSVFAYTNISPVTTPPGFSVLDTTTIINNHYNDTQFNFGATTTGDSSDYPDFSNLCGNLNSVYCRYRHTDSNKFGYYSDGRIIGSYYGSSLEELRWSFSNHAYTDSDGNVDLESQIYDSSEIRFVYDPGFTGSTSVTFVRLDFNIKIDFFDSNHNSVWDKTTERIFSDFFVSCDYPTACNYDIDMQKRIFSITLNSNNPTSPMTAKLYTTHKIGSILKSNSYTYYGRIIMSDATFAWTNESSLSGLDLSDSSINNSNLMDNYIKLESNVNTLFNYFESDHMHGLTQVVMAPQAFLLNIMQGNYDNVIINYNVNNDDLALSFNLFNKVIKIPSGKIFWNRGILSFHSNKYSTDSEKYRMLFNFRTTWSLLFGGFIIYKLLVKLYKVVLDSIQPDKERIESL